MAASLATEASLVEYIDERKTLIETALAARLPGSDALPQSVHAAIRYAVLSDGKRLRPILSLAVADLVARPVESILDTACAIELIHTASLILDDLPCMDDAVLRRGKPCTHQAFGEATALLAVVGLMALGFEWVARNAEALGQGASAAQKLAGAVGMDGLVGGQDIDLRGMAPGAPGALDLVERAHRGKAGALFVAAVQAPAAILGMPADQTSALETYAQGLGLAFQIADDLQDARVDGEDAGRHTAITYLGREGARRRVAELVEQTIEAVRVFGERAEPLRALARYVAARAE